MEDQEHVASSLEKLRRGQGLTALSLTVERHPVLMRRLGTDDPYEGVKILSELARKLGSSRQAKALRNALAVGMEDHLKNTTARREAAIRYVNGHPPLIPVSMRQLHADEDAAIVELTRLVMKHLPPQGATAENPIGMGTPPAFKPISTELAIYDPAFAKRYMREYLQGLKPSDWPEWAHDEPAYADMDASLYKQRYLREGYARDENARGLVPSVVYGKLVEETDEGEDYEPYTDWLDRLTGHILDWHIVRNWREILSTVAEWAILAIIVLLAVTQSSK